MDLGLTELQAKLYLALSKTGSATIKNASKAANIARQDLYRLMPALQKLGLVEKILTTPMMYKATPLKDGCSILLEKKTKEHANLQNNTFSLINSLDNIEYNPSSLSDEDQFIVTASINLIIKRFDEKDNLVQKSIDSLIDRKSIRNQLYNHFDNYSVALKRGIRIRIITEKHKDKAIKKKLEVLEKNHLFEIRYLPSEVPVRTLIRDGIEANLCISSSDSSVQNLGSKNPQFVKVMNTYFEELWKKADTKNEF